MEVTDSDIKGKVSSEMNLILGVYMGTSNAVQNLFQIFFIYPTFHYCL